MKPRDESPGARRLREHNERRVADGQVQVTVRAWVKEADEEKAREAMRDSVAELIVPAPPVND